MCSEWLKEESRSAFNSWKFHAISLSIIILELFSSNISRDLELFLLFFPFINYSLFSRSTWPQKAASAFLGAQTVAKEMNIGIMQKLEVVITFNPICDQFPGERHHQEKWTRPNKGTQSLLLLVTQKITKEKPLFWIFQLMFLGTQLLYSGSSKSGMFPALILQHRLVWLLGWWEIWERNCKQYCFCSLPW